MFFLRDNFDPSLSVEYAAGKSWERGEPVGACVSKH